MLKRNSIRPGNSPWPSPIWKVSPSGKKKWRIVVACRKVNEWITGYRYSTPNIPDVFDKLGKCQHFSTLYLSSGFHQIEMDPEDIPKTTFSFENSHYDCVRLSFGLKNAPATFQSVMDNIFKGLQNACCFIYKDDFINYGTSLQEDMLNLKETSKHYAKSILKYNLLSSNFSRKKVLFWEIE